MCAYLNQTKVHTQKAEIPVKSYWVKKAIWSELLSTESSHGRLFSYSAIQCTLILLAQFQSTVSKQLGTKSMIGEMPQTAGADYQRLLSHIELILNF